MKRYLIMLAALLCGFVALNAQGVQVKGKVVHTGDKQPMVGAEVVVKGSSIRTVTDVDGCFVLDDVPADLKKLEVSYIGMPSTTVKIKEGEELTIKMRPAERKFMPYVAATAIMSFPMSDDTFTPGFGYGVGVGVVYNISEKFALTSALEFTKLSATYEGWSDGQELKYSPVYLQVPVMMEVGRWVKNTTKFIIGLGGYVGFGIGGKCDMKGWGNDGEYDCFKGKDGAEAMCNSFDAGIRVAYKMQWMHIFTAFNVQMGLTDIFKETPDWSADNVNFKNASFSLSLGYRF